jgi:hypothetical protein
MFLEFIVFPFHLLAHGMCQVRQKVRIFLFIIQLYKKDCKAFFDFMNGSGQKTPGKSAADLPGTASDQRRTVSISRRSAASLNGLG